MSHALPSATPDHVRTRYLPIAAAASLAQAAMMIPGYAEDGSFQTASWFTMVAFSLAVSLPVFAFVVPGGGTTTGLVLGGLAVLSVLAFWASVTLPLAAAAATVGWRTRQQAGEHVTRANIALGLAAISAVLVVAAIVSDAVAG